MRNIGRRAWLAVVLVAAFTAACASSGPAVDEGADAGAASEGTTLRVHNTHGSGDVLTIFLVPAAGELKRLGTVAPYEYLTVPHTDGPGRFSLRAERPNGTRINSPTFTVVSGTYTWDLALRRVDRAR